jgi:hypothetical protein
MPRPCPIRVGCEGAIEQARGLLQLGKTQVPRDVAGKHVPDLL